MIVNVLCFLVFKYTDKTAAHYQTLQEILSNRRTGPKPRRNTHFYRRKQVVYLIHYVGLNRDRRDFG
jgi:hypothetical protein